MKTWKIIVADIVAFAFLATVLSSVLFAQGQSGSAEKEREYLKVLQSDAPEAEKALACKHLSVYGSSESVAELSKLLSNERLASWSRIALEVIPGTTADVALRKATASVQGRLLVGVINSIGVRRDAGAVELLSGRLGDNDAD